MKGTLQITWSGSSFVTVFTSGRGIYSSIHMGYRLAHLRCSFIRDRSSSLDSASSVGSSCGSSCRFPGESNLRLVAGRHMHEVFDDSLNVGSGFQCCQLDLILKQQ